MWTFDIEIGKCAVVKDPWGNQFVKIDGFLQNQY